MEEQVIIDQTRKWISQRVIGWNLCPFAKAPFDAGRVRIVVSEAKKQEDLLRTFLEEVQFLVNTSIDESETTLIVHPYIFTDFYDFNDFLGVLEDVLFEGELEADFQVAHFHPDYQFAETEKEEPGNYTNRSPFPTIHILRQASVTRGVTLFPGTDNIPERNITFLEEKGLEELRKPL